MTDGEENRRASVGNSITLSSQLITAALGMLTIEGAYLAFVLGARIITFWFWLDVALSSICFIVSIVVAGMGITATRNEGFNNNWSLQVGRQYFSAQSGLCFLGIVLFAVSIALSSQPKDLDFEEKFNNAQGQISQLQSQIDNLKATNLALQQNEIDLATKLDKLILVTPTAAQPQTQTQSVPISTPTVHP